MDEGHPTDARIAPDLVRRTGGGWLAIAPPKALVAIAVTAATADEAREKFGVVYGRWLEILEQKGLDVPITPH